ncbi:MAG: hypothetical protein V2I39_11630 [Erythrobacter sp.]|jgi:hypothetical protein|nr:hypothetical protein [Erythrobacter sp.]
MDNDHLNTSLSLIEARARLLACGVPDDLILRKISDACARGELIATGFQHAHHQDRHAASSERKRMPARPWRAASAPPPYSDESMPDRSEAFTVSVHWSTSSITLRLTKTGHEETWDAIAFDAVTFARLVARAKAANSFEKRDGAAEVGAWLEGYSGSNVRIGWKDYKRDLGSRAAKKSLFEDEWRRVHGRGRGRPPLSASAQ